MWLEQVVVTVFQIVRRKFGEAVYIQYDVHDAGFLPSLPVVVQSIVLLLGLQVIGRVVVRHNRDNPLHIVLSRSPQTRQQNAVQPVTTRLAEVRSTRALYNLSGLDQRGRA